MPDEPEFGCVEKKGGRMMPRLIDADILLTAFPKGENEIFRTSAVRGTIDACPTVDAIPVVHGEWQEENRRPRSSIFYCSICHRTAYDIQPTRDKAWKKHCRYAYCPHCGARMDGGENEAD